MAMNRKGMFFTVMVLLILTMFIVSYSLISGVEKRKTAEKRIETMSSFLSAMETDLERQLYISGFRVIFLMESKILDSGTYLADVNNTFQEAFFNGSIQGEVTPETQLLMNGATFSNITSIINTRAEKINVVINITEPVLEVRHDDPWNVKFSLRVNLSMNDKAGLASWNKEKFVEALVPIEGFEDPLYVIGTGGATPNVILHNISYTINITTAVSHATNTYYLNTTEAPSFIDRLGGKIQSASPHGIESLAVPKLSSISGRSIVDHQYFLGLPGQQVSGLPAWFIMDSTHCALYALTC